MPRNYGKEIEWARGRYKQVKFNVPHDVASEFQDHLDMHRLKAIDWFKYAVHRGLVPPGHAGTDTGTGAAPGLGSGLDTGTGGGGVTGPAADHVVGVDIGQAVHAEKKRKVAMPSPTGDMVAGWSKLHEGGMTFVQIAKDTGYEASTIRKRVNKHDAVNQA